MELKRDSVISLYLSGKPQVAIVRALQHLNVNKSFVSRTIARYRDTGSVARRQGSGRKKTATSAEMVRKVKKRLDRNPRRSGRKMARELNISQYSIRQILKNELGVKPLKFQKVQELTPQQKENRLKRAKELLRLAASGELPNLVFSDEKTFVVQQFVNKQNDRVYLPKRSAENVHLRLATRTQAPAMVMVWAAITADGRSPLVLIDRGIRINAEYYRENILEGVLKPWARKHFGRRPWTFEQDSAPLHSARATQEWLQNEVPRFISSAQWPPKSPDTNPLDYCVWSILESKVGTKKYQSVDHLKQALRREWAKIPQSNIRAACDGFIGRLKAIIRAKGDQFEQI